MATVKIEVYYDGWCPLCTATKGRLSKLDWRQTVRFVSMRATDIEARTGIPAARLSERMHCLDLQSGKVSQGIYAVADLFWHLPLLMPVAPLIRMAGWVGLGQPLYDWIANRRAIVPVSSCDHQSCALPRPSGRES